MSVPNHVYNTLCLFVHELMDIWVISAFFFLACVNSPAMNIRVFENLFSITVGR